HVDLHDLHSFPTRRSSDLNCPAVTFDSNWEDFDAPGITTLTSSYIRIQRRANAARAPSPLKSSLSSERAGKAFSKGTPENVSPLDRKSTRLNSSHVKISYA